MKETLIDWLEFTAFNNIPDDVNLLNLGESEKDYIDIKKEIENTVMLLDDFIKFEKGMLGYSNRLFNNNINILYGSNNNSMRIHVSMTGSGVRFYEVEHNSLNLIKKINEMENGHFTRLDIATDIKDKDILNFDDIEKYTRNNNMVTKFRNFKYIEENNIEKEKINNIGRTLYYGSKTSNIYIKFYEKGKEQGTNEDWLRCEVTLKDEHADTVADLMSSNVEIGHILHGILNNYIRFVEPSGKSKRKNRYPTADFWQKFLEHTKKIKLTQRGEQKTIKDTMQWLDKQAMESIAMYAIYDEDRFSEMFNLKRENMSKKNMKKLIQAVEERERKK